MCALKCTQMRETQKISIKHEIGTLELLSERSPGSKIRVIWIIGLGLVLYGSLVLYRRPVARL